MSVRHTANPSKPDVVDAVGLRSSTKKILLVEDNYLRRVAHMGIFRVMGYKNNVVFASSASEARFLSKQHDFMMILVNTDLSDANVVETCRRIFKEASKKQKNVPLIGIGSNDNIKRDRLKAGADMFVLKPLTIKSVTNMFNTLLPVRTKRTQGANIC